MENSRFKFRFWNKLRNAYENTYDLKCCEHLDYVIPEQCTGLKDKNGKLIYEKDLVTKGDDIYEVNWCHQKQGYIFRNLNCIDDVLEGLDITINEWEVVGNIHENADLLGEDK